MFSHAGDRCYRRMFSDTKRQLRIYLIRDNNDVFASYCLCDFFKVLFFHYCTRGVAGIGEYEGFRFVGNKGGKLFRSNLEIVLRLCVQYNGHTAGKASYGLVAYVTRLWNYDFVTGICYSAYSYVYCFASANGNEYFFLRVVAYTVFSFYVR